MKAAVIIILLSLSFVSGWFCPAEYIVPLVVFGGGVTYAVLTLLTLVDYLQKGKT